MRTVLDLTDDARGDDPSTLPDPGTLSTEGDDVVVQLREVEIRMTYQQLLALHEAVGAWLVRSCGAPDHVDGSLDLQGERYPWQEHEKLRRIFRDMLNDSGSVGRADVPPALRDQLRWELARHDVHPDAWRSLQTQAIEDAAKIAELQADVAELEGRLKPRSPRPRKGAK